MIVVSLLGLKKCGKTTTAEALIREFKRRGFKVGGVKCMHHAAMTIDAEGKDTFRQMEAGADFVISLSKGEIAYIEKKKGRLSLADALRHVPCDSDIIICEGLEDDAPGILRVVLAKSPELLPETFKIRGVEGGVLALSGVMANKAKRRLEYPVFNCTVPRQVRALADLILSKAPDM
ncbi:MAG: molybdopterin-guanine dinucleotide biosynthesis protein B [Euryarchaeota archaeon]|nr:molybdopterin-guanine dinucleotide biosynthesis protein B [Euryarchaeota archaeon]